MYVREYFKEEARQSVNEMVKDIQAVFNGIIDELDWMDDGTRGRAKEKAAAMTTHIAYPDELLDDKKLIDLYANVKKKKKTIYFQPKFERIFLFDSAVNGGWQWLSQQRS